MLLNGRVSHCFSEEALRIAFPSNEDEVEAPAPFTEMAKPITGGVRSIRQCTNVTDCGTLSYRRVYLIILSSSKDLVI